MAKDKTKTERVSEEKPDEKPVIILERHLKKDYRFRYNDITKQVEYRKAKSNDDFIPLDEERELPELRIELAKIGFKSYKTYLTDLVRTRSLSPLFNPFVSYFESLPKWKQGDREYISDLAMYVKVKDQEWFNIMFKKHLVRTVACALRELNFNKHCLTLQGEQNDGKTSFIRFLIPPILKDYYKDQFDAINKDSLIDLSRYLIINFDEVDRLDKTEAAKVKALFSQEDFKIRLPYGRSDTPLPRIATFFATINETEFLNDVTGNVRWLVFEVLEVLHDNGGINGYNHRININDVWAQAYSLLKSGFNYHLTKDEINEVNRRNKAFEKSFPEKELIPRYFEPSTKEHPESCFLTPTDICQAISYAIHNSIKINTTMIGRGLKVLGFKREKKGGVYGYWVLGNSKISEILHNHLTILPNSTLKPDNQYFYAG